MRICESKFWWSYWKPGCTIKFLSISASVYSKRFGRTKVKCLFALNPQNTSLIQCLADTNTLMVLLPCVETKDTIQLENRCFITIYPGPCSNSVDRECVDLLFLYPCDAFIAVNRRRSTFRPSLVFVYGSLQKLRIGTSDCHVLFICDSASRGARRYLLRRVGA